MMATSGISAADPHNGEDDCGAGDVESGSGVSVDAGIGVADTSRFMSMPASP